MRKETTSTPKITWTVIKVGTCFMKVFALTALLCISGCGSKISDSTIQAQVSDYISSLQSVVYAFPPIKIAFSEYFVVQKVEVKDKMIKDKKCVAICHITVKVKRAFVGDSAIVGEWNWLIGDGTGVVGKTRSKDVKFIFDKYDNGWRIQPPPST
jgi:hypothetical protein